MACSNCYNGCSEIVSDRCVKYTGVAVPILEIETGDSLSYVTQALVNFLTATLNGSGITIEIDEEDYCELVTQYLQECSTVTAFDLFKALVKAACDLQTQIEAINASLTTLNADYAVDCLSGVTNASDTHDVVQAVITKLCSLEDTVSALSTDLDTNYVKLSELNDLVGTYIESTASATRYSSRMVPYSILPYYGSLGVFDATGAGLAASEWEDIYLCNGQNSTPDLRGRALVGAISGVPGGALDSSVDPGSSAFNPNYSLGTAQGANSIVLTETQIPSHTHALTDPGHTHHLATEGQPSVEAQLAGDNYISSQGDPGGNSHYVLQYDTSLPGDPDTGIVETVETGITLSNTGGGQGHSNIQPSMPVYYIMYIPS